MILIYNLWKQHVEYLKIQTNFWCAVTVFLDRVINSRKVIMSLRYDMIQDYITVKGNKIFIMQNFIHMKICAKFKFFKNKLNLNYNL